MPLSDSRRFRDRGLGAVSALRFAHEIQGANLLPRNIFRPPVHPWRFVMITGRDHSMPVPSVAYKCPPTSGRSSSLNAAKTSLAAAPNPSGWPTAVNVLATSVSS